MEYNEIIKSNKELYFMRLPLAYYGDPILRKKVKPIMEITDDIRVLASDMIETMHATNGIGLAAPQIHVSLAIFVTNVPVEQPDGTWVSTEDRVYINPKVIEVSKELVDSREGCLSIPKVPVVIQRPHWIRIEALDLDGNRIQREFSDLDAFNFLHENDHLNGVLIIDRLLPAERKKLEPKLRRIKKNYQKS